MKKMKFLSLAAATLAVSSMWTSCSSDDNPTPTPIDINVGSDTYSVYVVSNEAANFSVDVKATAEISADKKSASFTGIASSYKQVTVTAKMVNGDGYVNPTQTAVVNFADMNTAAAIVFNFVKKSTTKSQKEVAESTTPVVVTGDLLKPQMTIPGGTTVEGGGDEPFSVTVLEDETFILTADKVVMGKPLASNFVLKFTPSTGKLSGPVSVTLTVGTELAGKTITLKNGNKTVTGTVQADGTVTFEIDDLSGEWTLDDGLVPVTAVAGSVQLTSYNMNLSSGVNYYSYTMNIGCRYSYSGIVEDLINKYFGARATTKEVKGSFSASGEGTASIVVDQHYVDYQVTYLGNDYNFRVWGNAYATINPSNGDPVVQGHSGGSGR
jgi:hypothetical protein